MSNCCEDCRFRRNFQTCCESHISYLFSHIRHDTVLSTESDIFKILWDYMPCPVGAVQLYRNLYPNGPLFPSGGPLIPFPVSCESHFLPVLQFYAVLYSPTSADLLIYSFLAKIQNSCYNKRQKSAPYGCALSYKMQRIVWFKWRRSPSRFVWRGIWGEVCLPVWQLVCEMAFVDCILLFTHFWSSK